MVVWVELRKSLWDETKAASITSLFKTQVKQKEWSQWRSLMEPGDNIYSRGGEGLHLKNQRTRKGKQLPSPFQIFLFCSYTPLAILNNNPENKWGICRLQPFGDRREEMNGQYPESAWRVINSNRDSYREKFSKSTFNHNSQDFCPSN